MVKNVTLQPEFVKRAEVEGLLVPLTLMTMTVFASVPVVMRLLFPPTGL